MSHCKMHPLNEEVSEKASFYLRQAGQAKSITLVEPLVTMVQHPHQRPVYPVKASTVQVPIKYPEMEETDEGWLQRAAKHIPCFGIILSLIASVLIGTAGLLVKMTDSVHGVQVSVFRAIIQTAIYGIILICWKVKPKPARGEFWPVFGRALLCSCSITGAYFAIKLIPLGDSTIIKLSLPIWVLLISYFVLNEGCNFTKISAVTVALTGVTLVAKPEDCLNFLDMIKESFMESGNSTMNQPKHVSMKNHSFTLNPQVGADSLLDVEQNDASDYSDLVLGRSLALASSISLALSIISLRMCKVTPVEVIIFWLSVMAVVFGSGLLLILGEWSMPDNWNDVGLILLNGMLGALGQWFLSSSLKVEQSGVISLVRTFDILVAFFYSATILNEEIPTTSIVGAILVSYGTFAVAVPKLLAGRKPQ